MHEKSMSRSARRVQDALIAAGTRLKVTELPGSTRTAEDAAATLGCDVAQIAKTLVFRATPGENAVIAVVSGINQVDTKRLASLHGQKLKRADADFVRDQTGFAIGGVAPVGLTHALPIYLDEDLMGLSCLFAAAGTPNSVFELEPDELRQITGGRVVELKKS